MHSSTSICSLSENQLIFSIQEHCILRIMTNDEFLEAREGICLNDDLHGVDAIPQTSKLC